MEIQPLLRQLDNSDHVLISDKQLSDLIKSLKIVFEENTLISDFIRIFEFENFFIYQEKTPKGEIIIRKFNDKITVDHLVQKRLDIYENMWNGCGCRIDYYSVL